MRMSSKPSRGTPAEPDADVVLTDDGGSGLFEACSHRFPAPDYKVACDASHTVWVKRTDGSRSIGLPPWLLNRRSVDEALDNVAAKLEAGVGPRER